jgi:hypothetical protein
MQTIGEAYMQPLSQAERNATQATNSRTRAAISNMRLEMTRQRLVQLQQMAGLQLANLKERQNEFNQTMDLKNKQFDATQNDSPVDGMTMSQYRAFEARKAGLPYEKATSSGDTGRYKMPTNNDQSKLEQVINAFPQIQSLLGQIQNGAKYYMNKPDKFKKYTAAISAAWTGGVTPGQEKVLEDAGISSNAIIQTAEVQSRLMNVAKTNDTFQNTLSLFKPREGETTDSYNARLNAVLLDNARRFFQAQLQLQDVPLNDAAQKDQNDKVDHELLTNGMLSSVNGSKPQSISIGDKGFTEAQIKKLMDATGMSRDQAITQMGG